MRVEQFVLNEARNVVLTAYIQETGGTYKSWYGVRASW